ncbi:hypothetical protein KJ641_02080 [Patescibacteria group bacterium]|nr:hypothetical protein [Patescibacteria group bacterium]
MENQPYTEKEKRLEVYLNGIFRERLVVWSVPDDELGTRSARIIFAGAGHLRQIAIFFPGIPDELPEGESMKGLVVDIADILTGFGLISRKKLICYRNYSPEPEKKLRSGFSWVLNLHALEAWDPNFGRGAKS